MEQRRVLRVDLGYFDLLEHDWLFVVLEAPTGTVYHLQTCGTSCVQSEVEGHLVPLQAPDSYAALNDLFVREFAGTGGPRTWTPVHLSALRAAVAPIRLPLGTAPTFFDLGYPGTPVHVDESRLSEATEAWIPVTTEFGNGILVWPNSD
ncbi:DUF6210 family protein [Embleya sp. NPDC001921]